MSTATRIPTAFMRALTLAACLSVTLAAPSLAIGGGGGGHGAAAPAEDSRHRTVTSSETYLPLPPLMATVQANYRARGNLQIEAGLEIEDARLRQRVEQIMPRLRNAYVSALSVYTGVNYRYGTVPDADRIAQLLQDATDMTLGTDGARVLIGMVILNPN